MFTARIKTSNGNYLALENKGYGTYSVMWFNSEMKPIEKGRVEQWLWACSSWQNTIEIGEWNVDCPETAYFGDIYKSEVRLEEYIDM